MEDAVIEGTVSAVVFSNQENGYAVLHITGRDGLNYITIINRNGDVLYDPMPVRNANSRLSEGNVVFTTFDGDYTVYQLLNVDGSIREIFRIVQGMQGQYQVFDVREGYVIVQRRSGTNFRNSHFKLLNIETGMQIGSFE